MTASQMILAELLALRCVTAALAREMLLNNGSDAFLRAQAQAENFVNTATKLPNVDQPTIERALRIVSDTFTMADGGT